MKINAKKLNRLHVGAFVTIACTAALSFTSTQHLAAMAGFGWSSWLFPITLDAVAAVAMDVWMRRVKDSWHWAAALSGLTIALSLAANVADHWYSTHTVLATVLGAVPPLVLAGLLVVMHRHAAALAKRRQRSAAARKPRTTTARKPATKLQAA